MPYKMINKTIGINDPLGVTTRLYQVDEVIPDSPEWLKQVGERFVRDNHAMIIDSETVIPMTKVEDMLPSDVEPQVEEKPRKKLSIKTIKYIKKK